jgi:cobalt-zinc-cadmium efflux system outer membrane protein
VAPSPAVPILVAYRLGVGRARADANLAGANRLSDVYLLDQPYTFQNNAPSDAKSADSWAVGVTVPLPVLNRNQGNIRRPNGTSASQRPSRPPWSRR